MVRASKQFDMELFFRALADRTRLRLINLMQSGEVCVCFFVEILGTNQPKISRHLAYLKRAGIDEAAGDKYRSYYDRVRTSPPDAADVRDFISYYASECQDLPSDSAS